MACYVGKHSLRTIIAQDSNRRLSVLMTQIVFASEWTIFIVKIVQNTLKKNYLHMRAKYVFMYVCINLLFFLYLKYLRHFSTDSNESNGKYSILFHHGF